MTKQPDNEKPKPPWDDPLLHGTTCAAPALVPLCGADDKTIEPSTALVVEVRQTAPLSLNTWTVWIVNGVQSFRLDYKTTQPECEWYARMLRKALGIEERCVSWVEPFGPNNEAVHMRVTEATAIAKAKAVAAEMGHTYVSDETALEDFIAVHWATKC